MKKKTTFDTLSHIALLTLFFVLFFGIILKAIIPEDLIDNYNFLSDKTIAERFYRGIDLIEFYKTENAIRGLSLALLLDALNVVAFVPFGVLIAHCFKSKKVLKTLAVTLFFSIAIEVFQLLTVIGAFMLNDLIFNVLGGLIDAVIYVILMKHPRYKVYNTILVIFIAFCLALLVFLIINFATHIDIFSAIFTKSL